MRIVATLILLFSITIPSFAGDVARKGTTGADQLLIPVGARSIALSGAFLSSVTGLESIYYNPAGLDVSRKSEGMFSNMSYIGDISVSYFAAGTSLGDFGSIALSFKTLNFGTIPVTTLESPDGTGSTYSPSFVTAGLTFSKIITDRVSIGVNAKVISETIMSSSAMGFAIDFGVQYRFEKTISIGAAIKNIGTDMKYMGNDLEFKSTVPGTSAGSTLANVQAVTESFQIPSYFELSAGYDVQMDKDNLVMLGGTFTNNNSFEDQMKVGLEYSFQKMFYLRGGYNLPLKNASASIYGATFGAGVDYKLSDGIGITFDYAYRQVKDFANANHVFTVKLAVY